MKAKYNSVDCRISPFRRVRRLPVPALGRIAAAFFAARRSLGGLLDNILGVDPAACLVLAPGFSAHPLAARNTAVTTQSMTGLNTPGIRGALWQPPAPSRLLGPVPSFRVRAGQAGAQES